MKHNWENMVTIDEKEMDQAISICKQALQHTIIRHEHRFAVILFQFLKMELRYMVVGYLLFGLLLIWMLLSELNDTLPLIVYHLALGIFFITRFMKQKLSHMDELVYTLPINGAKLFIFHFISFSILFFTGLAFMVEALQTQLLFSIADALQISVLPLCISISILLLINQRIRTYQSALAVYSIIYMFIISICPIQNIPFSFSSALTLPDNDVITIALVSISVIILVFASFRYTRQLNKEIAI